MSAIHKKRPTLSLKQGVFLNDFPGYSVLIERIDDKTSEIEGITIYETKGNETPVTIRARQGELAFSPENDRLTLTLYEGEIHEVDDQDPMKYRRLTFEKHVLHINNLGTELKMTQSQNRGDREMGIQLMKEKITEYRKVADEHSETIRTIIEEQLRPVLPASLLETMLQDLSSVPKEIEDRLYEEDRSILRKLQTESRIVANSLRQVSKYEVEIHKKISIPVACLVFVLVGTSLGVLTRRGGWPLALGISFFFFVLYWAFLIGGEQLADRRMVPAGWAMWAPNIVIGALGIFLLRYAVYESAFAFTGRSRTREKDEESE
jgi:lipopolysaccharide export system permease protein